MSLQMTDVSVRLPDASARARAAAAGRKPMAEVSCTVEGGRVREVVVPVRAARALEAEGLGLPREEQEAFDALHALEGRVCFTMLTEMLSRRDHAAQEVRTKLASYGFRPQEIVAAIERAPDMRFLNDARFASYFIEERKRRGWGRRKIELELRRRGVDVGELAGYPEAFFDEDDDLQRALQLLERKSVPAARAQDKFIRHLMAKGFPYAVAARAARMRLEGEQDRA